MDAVEHARTSGAPAVEAYPHADKGDYMGSLEAYVDAGFGPVRSAGKRQVVRLSL